MKSLRLLKSVLIFCSLILPLSTFAATTVANLAVDYDTKFQFLWNAPTGWVGDTYDGNNQVITGSTGDMSTGALTVISSLKPLVKVGATTRYTADGDAFNPGSTPNTQSNPSRYLSISDSGSTVSGHPGWGTAQQSVVGGAPARHVVTAFTVTIAGSYLIENSTLYTGATSGGVDATIFTLDVSTGNVNTIGTWATGNLSAAAINFNTNVGDLDVGDKIYVAFGAQAQDTSDSFNANYAIAYNAVPEPARAMLAVVGMLAIHLRRRRV